MNDGRRFEAGRNFFCEANPFKTLRVSAPEFNRVLKYRDLRGPIEIRWPHAGRDGATARWARRAIRRGMTDLDTARIIAALQWALEQEDRAA